MGGVDALESHLTEYLLKFETTEDNLRMICKINPCKSAVSRRIRFGFGRIQRNSSKTNWQISDTAMPGVNVKQFSRMLTCLGEQTMILFELATKFTSAWNKDAFPNKTRNHLCAGYLNQAMGYPKSASLFEYFDIVVSRNAVLRKHCDVKNDHREGYNVCCVYSYFKSVCSLEYKISIIMTTRTTLGCAFKKAMLNK